MDGTMVPLRLPPLVVEDITEDLRREVKLEAEVKVPKGIIPLKEFVLSKAPDVPWNLVHIVETRYFRLLDILANLRLHVYVNTVSNIKLTFAAWAELSKKRSEVVFYAAVFRAFDMVKTRTNDAIQSMQKGQLVLLGKNDTDALTSFHLDITYDDRKFSFQVTRKRSDIYCFTINGGTVTANVREQLDGSLHVTVGHRSQRIKGQEEALGLRLSIGSQTIMVPNVYEPDGKLVCPLHEDGTEIVKGDTVVELDMNTIPAPKDLAMMPPICQAAREASKVKKISPFKGVFSLGEDLGSAVAAEPLQEVLSLLDGFCIEAKGPEVVKKMFQGFSNHQAAVETVRGLLEKYLSNERPFAASIDKKQPYDQLLLEIIDQGKDDLEKVLFTIAAHNKMASRNETVMAILTEMVAAEQSGMSCMYAPGMCEEMDGVYQKVVEISQLQGRDYGDMAYLAQQLLDDLPQESSWPEWLCCGSRPAKVRGSHGRSYASSTSTNLRREDLLNPKSDMAPALESLEEAQWPWFEWLQLPGLSWIF